MAAMATSLFNRLCDGVIHCGRSRHAIVLALPIIGAMMSQNILNLIDTAMVGVLGAPSLAGVGVGGFMNFMAVAAIIGLSSGVQAMASRRMGEGRTSEMAVPLNGGLVLAIGIGLPLSVACYFGAPYLFPVINPAPEVITEGTPYLQWRLVGMVAVGCNFAYRGYFNGVGRSSIYMKTLLVVHALNVMLNYLLIFGKFGFPEMGAAGAGAATTISIYVGTLIYTVLGFRLARENGFFHRTPRGETMATMLRLAVPSGLQQFLFAAGFTAFFWIIGHLGTNEVAVSNVLFTLILVAILPGMGLGLAALSLVSEALGRGEPVEAKRWGWDVGKLGMLALGLLGSVAVFWPDVVLSGFLHEAALIDLGRWPTRLAGGVMVFEGLNMVLLNTLLGAGAVGAVMRVSVITQWVIGLPLAWLVGPVLGYGLVAVWLANAFYRMLQTLLFAIIWQRGHWARIKI